MASAILGRLYIAVTPAGQSSGVLGKLVFTLKCCAISKQSLHIFSSALWLSLWELYMKGALLHK